MMFHLAIPSHDLSDSLTFYKMLGAKDGRSYKTHIVLDFFSHQLVCHLMRGEAPEPTMYPRHFGIIFDTKSELEALWEKHQHMECVFERYFVRHRTARAEHHTFFLKDPSNNVIEFKWYANPMAVLG